MPFPSIDQLTGFQLTLVDHFYKSCGIKTRCGKTDSVFVLRDSHAQGGSSIIAAVRYLPVEPSIWLLRNLAVAPDRRGQGIAGYLLAYSLEKLQPSECYCFAFNYLEALYENAGFQVCAPEDAHSLMAADFARYVIHRKNLLLMKYLPESPELRV